MNYLEKSILKTLAYYDIFDWPLTEFEIWRYLSNPKRFAWNAPDETSMSEIDSALHRKPLSDYVSIHLGFYFLKDRDNKIVSERLRREMLADMKWKIIRRRARWLRLVPYVRLVLVSGSLAIGNVHEKSDADLLIVTRAGRIWTCRGLITLFLDFLRWRRRGNDTKNKLCLNHYITDQSLLIDVPSIYNAHTYAHLVPILGNLSVWRSFQERNAWIKSYLAHFPLPYISHMRAAPPGPALSAVAWLGERILNAGIGEAVERFFGRLQAEKIARNPKTGTSGGRILYSSDVLEFHPDSKEHLIIQRLNQRLTELGFPELADEKDSGLT